MALSMSTSIGCSDVAEAEEGPWVPQHSPTILNASRHSMTVFQERGAFYNCQVLKPGEAVSMTRKQTAGPFRLVPYRIHAVVGDESCLPSRGDGARNLMKVSAIPAAFVAGTLATAVAAGTLAGPSAALAPLVSGMVVKGVAIDATALAAGGMLAARAGAVADVLLKEKPDCFMRKTGPVLPGRRYFVVTGGLADGAVTVEEVSQTTFEEDCAVTAWKPPLRRKVPVDPDDGRDDVEILQEGGGEDVELLLLGEKEGAVPAMAQRRSVEG